MNAKSLGIFGLLVMLFVFMVLMTSDPWTDIFSSTFLQANNLENLLRRVSMYGLLGIGVAFVIITGGIDLSVGSIVCLAGCLLMRLLIHCLFIVCLASCLLVGGCLSGDRLWIVCVLSVCLAGCLHAGGCLSRNGLRIARLLSVCLAPCS